MTLKLNLFFGGEPSKDFLNDISKLNKLPKKMIDQLLTKMVEWKIFDSITYDDFKEWEKTTKTPKADLRSGASVVLWLVRRTIQEDMNREDLWEDFEKLKLDEAKISIMIDYIEKNREKIKTSMYEGKEYKLSTLGATSYRIDYKLEDHHNKLLSPTLIFTFSINDEETDELVHKTIEMKIDTLRVVIDRLNNALIKMENLEKNKDKIDKFVGKIIDI